MIRNIKGKRLLFWQLKKENVEIVKFFVKYDNNCINYTNTVFEYLSSEDYWQLHDKYVGKAMSDNIENHCGEMILLNIFSC